MTQKFNIENALSDHNIIGGIFRVKGVAKNNLEFKKRKWNNFQQESYNEKVKSIDWKNNV